VVSGESCCVIFCVRHNRGWNGLRGCGVVERWFPVRAVVLSFMLGMTWCSLLCGYIASVCEYSGEPASKGIFFAFVASLTITWLVAMTYLFRMRKK
jgi:hypothetical protein